jgi:putative chitinase
LLIVSILALFEAPCSEPLNLYQSIMDITLLKTKLPAAVYAQLPGTIQTFGINTSLKLSHFLSQCAHESINFTAVTENLNYSAAALLKTFPTHFTAEQAQTYQRKPEMIANRAYANRNGNGNEASGDGWRFRGRGFIQLTGRINYVAFAKFMNVPAVVTTPDIVANTYAMQSAAYFFKVHNIFAMAELGATDEVVKQVTKIVNGGYNGLDDRTRLFHVYHKILVPGALV